MDAVLDLLDEIDASTAALRKVLREPGGGRRDDSRTARSAGRHVTQLSRIGEPSWRSAWPVLGIADLADDPLQASFPVIREAGSIIVAGFIGGALLGAALGFLQTRRQAGGRRQRLR